MILPLSLDNVVCPNCRQDSRLCQLLCPPDRQMGTFAHSRPHATITAKLFCFSRNVENRTVVFGSPPALGAGGPGSNPGAPTTNLQKLRLYSTMFRRQTLEEKICST